MQLVIADTGPINYLILIGCVDVLPRLFERVALPRVVKRELSDPDTPERVRNWVAAHTVWLEIHDIVGLPDVSGLDDNDCCR